MGKKKLMSGKPPVHHEQGAVTLKKSGVLNIAIVYPNTYHAGMSNLGFQSVYSLFNAHDNVACHRFFLPETSREQKCHQFKPFGNETPDHIGTTHNNPAGNATPQSIETGMDLSSYDIIAFSLSFENDYLNILHILKAANIPLRSGERENSIHALPLVIAGGVASFLNPEPVAPFIDCFLMGEAEELIDPFINILFTYYTQQLDKDNSHALKQNPPILNTKTKHNRKEQPYWRQPEKHDLLKKLATTMKGVYVPALYNPEYRIKNGIETFTDIKPCYPDIPKRVTVQRSPDLKNISTTTQILTNDTAFNNTFLIETGRGCPHGCRFCSAGFIYRPPRFYPDQIIIDAMNKASLMTDKIGLVSAAVSDHPGINSICAAGIANNQKISFSSLRLDNLTDETIQTLVDSSVKTATIAPEAGSERMRRIINKKITEAQILSAVQRIVAHGILNIKLYFMTGLPFETDVDIQDIVSLTLKIKQTFLEASRKNRKIGTITLSINPFIPKPFTPFQWAAMDTPSTFKKKIKIIREGLKREGNITINSESPRMAAVNALLSRGDRRMADLLEAAEKKGWSQAIKNSGIESTIFNPLDMDATLPWDILDAGIKKSFLKKEYQKASMEKISKDCPMKTCSECGICRDFGPTPPTNGNGMSSFRCQKVRYKPFMLR
ncbi:Radical SAM domain protein [Desulfamplus magnetovallimortis]|uniref:Radical SAM domain protein n=1 Tax=Desulfamplus magnetovallimortis TaxID=1246637 RepID=A0A1W1HDY1_9BACT|nr:radical SAM protein [Desulfamplus magnetovallimortis]SLM30680.1 Radical SAM domain protein [Desulfamplus magnetovallimortis]